MILKADAISHRFSPRGPGVLRGVSAEFRAGEVTAIVGPNGSGKTTLLRLLMGLERPTSGAATLDGADTAGLSAGDRAARMAYMPQHDAVAFDFTAEQVVGFGLFRAGRDGAVVHECLERVGLGDRGGSAVRTLSAGQRQRVSLARVLAQLSRATEGSGVLLADEPIAALDPAHARTAMGLLRREASRGRAVVVVLHELHAVLRAADRVLVMDAGGTVAGWGPPGEVLTPQRLAGVYGVEFDPVLDAGGRLRALLPPLDAASG